jgi:hypothetical protein
MHSKAGMEDVTSGESGLERADSGLFNQPVCNSLGVYIWLSPVGVVYEYNKQAPFKMDSDHSWSSFCLPSLPTPFCNENAQYLSLIATASYVPSSEALIDLENS